MPYRRIFNIALPIIGANLLMPLQSIIDSAIAGRLNNSAFLAGLSLASSLLALLFISFNFLQYATSGQSTQASGQQNNPLLFAIFWRAICLAVLIGLFLLLCHPLIIELGSAYFAANNLTDHAMRDYLHIRFLGAPLDLMLFVFIGFFAGTANSKAIFTLQSSLTVLNLIFSLGLVYGLSMGIKGIALGTIIALFCTLCFAFFYIKKQYAKPEKTLKNNLALIFNKTAFYQLLFLNRDLFIRTLLLTLCFSYFQRLGAQLGSETLAANALLFLLLTVAAYALDGIAVAAETLTGQHLQQPDIRQTIIKKTLIAGISLACLISVVYKLGFNIYLNAMTTQTNIIQIAQNYAWAAIGLPIAGVLGYLADGYYFAATHAAPLRNAMLIITPIALISAHIGVTYAGNTGIWLAVYLFLLLRPVILLPAVLQNRFV